MNMRYFFPVLLLLCPLVESADTVSGRVVKVSDGDTIAILDNSKTQHRIRLQGIDTPERKQPYGRKSGKYLSEAVAGEHVVVDYDKRDRYKRIIGKVLLNDQDMNLRQVKAALAWHYKKYQKEQSAEEIVCRLLDDVSVTRFIEIGL